MSPARRNVKPVELGVNARRQYDWRDTGQRGRRQRRVKVTPPVAQYEQLARLMRQRILDGDWAPGVTLDGAPTLAREYSVTQSVAQRALETLVSWRLARVGERRGTVVLALHRYHAAVTCARTALAGDDALALFADALDTAAQGDPTAVSVGAVPAGDGAIVAGVFLAAHSGHAGDRLCELVRAAAGRAWDLAGASVEARPAGGEG
jgi:DNA-binding transcriptional regulator YhcF (GntR family)